MEVDLKRLITKTIAKVIKEKTKNASKVFITGHINADMDSIASSIGLQKIMAELGLDAYVVIDDSKEKLFENGLLEVVDANRNKYNIIDSKELEKLLDDNSVFIIADVSKKHLIPKEFRDNLLKFKTGIIIDHHKSDEKTINGPYKIYSLRVSSSSEIVALVYKTLLGEELDEDLAVLLHSGISLDTRNFTNNVSSLTEEVEDYLIKNSSTREKAKKILDLSDEEKNIHDQILLECTNILNYEDKKIAMCISDNPDIKLNKKIIGKLADLLSKSNSDQSDTKFDASFVIGRVGENICISARSYNEGIDVGRILSRAGYGNGSKVSAGGFKVIGEDYKKDFKEVENMIMKRLDEYFNIFSNIVNFHK